MRPRPAEGPVPAPAGAGLPQPHVAIGASRLGLPAAGELLGLQPRFLKTLLLLLARRCCKVLSQPVCRDGKLKQAPFPPFFISTWLVQAVGSASLPQPFRWSSLNRDVLFWQMLARRLSGTAPRCWRSSVDRTAWSERAPSKVFQISFLSAVGRKVTDVPSPPCFMPNDRGFGGKNQETFPIRFYYTPCNSCVSGWRRNKRVCWGMAAHQLLPARCSGAHGDLPAWVRRWAKALQVTVSTQMCPSGQLWVLHRGVQMRRVCRIHSSAC